MSDYDDKNRGVLFKNEKKETEKQPDYTGKVDVNGTEYRLAAWLRKAKTSGKTFMSLSVSLEDGSKKERAESAPTMANDFDDPDLPF